VQYHQDFLFEPHSNYDLVAVLFFLDEVTETNGPLELVPGSHLGPLYDHWHDGLFTGAIAADIAASLCENSIPCTGSAGSACLMHTRLVHGSRVNESMNSRTFYIVTYSAEDAYPLVKNHIPSRYEGEVVRGISTNRVRNVPFEMMIPEYPEEASFFSQQAKTALVN
jgi:phytanoyl-CoA hydroxylase